MKRPSTYVGQTVYEWNLSAPSQYAMTALAKVCQTLFGTTTTVNGLACTPTSPAGMTVLVGPGEIYQMASLEATACGTLPADTAHQILKQGIQLDTFTSSAFATPSTSGQSIAYLIQAQYADQDISVDPTTGNTPVVLQYYNSTTPSSPWSGPNDSGSTSNTFRDGVVSISIKAGAAAATGSQVTPSPDSGYVGLSVVTVAYGQTSITAANIVAYPNAPRLSDSLLNQISARAPINGSVSNRFSAAPAVAGTDVPQTQQIQSGAAETAVASGTANAIILTRAVPVTALTDQMKVRFKAVAANTGPVTLNDSTLGAKSFVGQGNAAFVGGEIVAGGEYEAILNLTAGTYQLVAQSGGAMQGSPGQAASHVAILAQLNATLGGTPRMTAAAVAGATTVTFTDDAVLVATSLSGATCRIPNFSATLNLATVGIGGMDTGTATAGGFLAIYAAYNPTTGAAGVFGTMEGASAAPTVYAKGNGPAGYAQTALISVLPISNTAGQLLAFSQIGRSISLIAATIVSNGAMPSTPTALTVTLAPYSAKRLKISIFGSTSNGGLPLLGIGQNSASLGNQQFGAYTPSGGSGFYMQCEIDLQTPRTIYYGSTGQVGFSLLALYLPGYYF